MDRHLRSVGGVADFQKYRDRKDEKWVDKKALAEHFAVSTSTIDRWQKAEDFPRFKPFGPTGMVRYRISEVEDWLGEKPPHLYPVS